MKRTSLLRLTALVFAATLAWTAAAAEPGYVDFGKLTSPEKGEFVEITLGKGMLKLAGIIAKCNDPVAADIISGLSQVRVNVVGLDDTNRHATTERISSVKNQLTQDGWEQIIMMHGKKHEDVAVFVKQREGEVIQGVVVTVMDAHKTQAVLVNIVGRIKPEQLDSVATHLQLPNLQNVL
jgi:hypothetical protein